MPVNTTFGYLGNPKLRRAYTQISVSQYEIDEFKKCHDDPIYFIRNYMKIIVLGKGIQPFTMWDFQEDMIRTFDTNRFVICKIPRQSGKTITTVGYLLHAILFNEQLNVAILAHKGSAANGILARLKLAYENLPPWLQSGIIEWNKGNIELENGSTISSYATSADGLRSGSFDIILLDEFAFVPSGVAEEFFTSTYPVITAGTDTKIIIVSTPHGMNHYSVMWHKAKKGLSDYIPIEVHWSAIPGRDEKWKIQTVRNTSQLQFDQEFECEFIGSTNTLISGAFLINMLGDEPKKTEELMDIYEMPERGHTYCISVDVSEGLGLDYHTLQVIDVSSIPYKQVAVYRSNQLDPILYPALIYAWAQKYNEAFVLVEINSVGLQIANDLHFSLAYENLLKFKVQGKRGLTMSAGFARQVQYGLKQSVQTKRIGCVNLKTLIESNKLIIQDQRTIDELITFSSKGKSYEAEDGKNDDLVMGLVNFAWLTAQPVFKEAIKSDIRQALQKEMMDISDSEMMPMPVINNQPDEPQQWVGGDLWKDVKRENPFDENYTYHGRNL